MGFMDKVKAQATVLAEKAQEGVNVGQAKISALQAKRQGDALLLEFGGLTYLKAAGRPPGDADAQIARVADQLRQFEAEHGPVTVTSATLLAPAPPDSSFVPSSSAGGTPPAPSTGSGIPASSGGIPTGSYSSDSEG